MLAPAWLHQDELQKEYRKIIYNPEYKYLVERVWEFEIALDQSDEHRLQLVSLNSKGGVEGFFQCNIDRVKNSITSIEAIAFKQKSTLFSIDFHRFILSFFKKHHFRKVVFEAIADSPADKIYQKHLKRYNAREVGILKQEAFLSDGKYYDVKIYEILSF